MKGQDLLCSKVTLESGAQESDSQSVDTLRQWVFWHVRSDSEVSHFIRSGFSIMKEIKDKISRQMEVLRRSSTKWWYVQFDVATPDMK
jgi:hypothetical protein